MHNINSCKKRRDAGWQHLEMTKWIHPFIFYFYIPMISYSIGIKLQLGTQKASSFSCGRICWPYWLSLGMLEISSISTSFWLGESSSLEVSWQRSVKKRVLQVCYLCKYTLRPCTLWRLTSCFTLKEYAFHLVLFCQNILYAMLVTSILSTVQCIW